MAWVKTYPEDDGLLINAPGQIRANWDALELGTDSALLITNAKVATNAAIAESKLLFSGSGHDHTGSTNGKQIPLASAVTGQLPVANGGTGSSVQNFVDLTLAQVIAGIKTFLASPIIPTPTTDMQASTKKYADDLVANISLVPSLCSNGFCGDGSDGDVTIAGATDISGMVKQYNNLTINPGVTLTAKNSMIFVKGTLIINGTISADGGGYSGAGGAYGATLQSTPGGTGGGLSTLISFGGGGGGGGGVGTETYNCYGGVGGSSGGSGGSGGTYTGDNAVDGIASVLNSSFSESLLSELMNFGRGAGGGGGGAYGNGAIGGNGGAGGGFIYIECDELIFYNGAIISSNGDSGGTYSTQGGGGGGGGGGTVVVRAKTVSTNAGTLQSTGGAGGSGSSGHNGGDGAVGYAVIVDV